MAIKDEFSPEARAQIAALNEELDGLLYTISHDIRTPLRALDGFSAALEEDYSAVLDDTGQDYLRRIHLATAKAEGYIQGLLKVSRLTRGYLSLQKIDLSKEATTLNDVAAQAYPGRAVRANIQEGITVVADVQLMRTMLAALIDNAWKFTAQSCDSSFSLTTIETEHGQAVAITDNGIGFDMEHAASRLFSLFQRLQDEFEGSGIGLATARRIVNRHGGRIWAEAQPGKGATFFFLLPQNGLD